MKRTILAGAISALAATSAFAGGHEAKIGVLLGFTGPIESLTPDMGDGAEMAMNEINASGMSETTLIPVRGDGTCVDAAAATAVAERMITSDGVAAIMGSDCSGVTTAILQNVALANGTVMISPSATSPALTTVEDNDLFFRTAPSDARQGQVLSAVLNDRGIGEVAVTYTNNDYGKGLADAFISNFEASGGKVTINAPHEDGKGDYSAEVAALASAGGDVLVVLGYVDQGGLGIMQSSLDTGAFDIFALGDGMFGQSLIDNLGSDIEGSFGSIPWSEGEGTDAFVALAGENDVNSDGPFVGESYDAAALLGMAIASGMTDDLSAAIWKIANGPGEEILPGQLGKAIEILKAGGDVDYVGATNVEMIGPGEASGTYREYTINGGEFETVQFR